jgi:hypothetical protein
MAGRSLDWRPLVAWPPHLHMARRQSFVRHQAPDVLTIVCQDDEWEGDVAVLWGGGFSACRRYETDATIPIQT